MQQQQQQRAGSQAVAGDTWPTNITATHQAARQHFWATANIKMFAFPASFKHFVLLFLVLNSFPWLVIIRLIVYPLGISKIKNELLKFLFNSNTIKCSIFKGGGFVIH